MKLQESKNDFYTRKAKEEGLPSRSVYKLKEIQEKFAILKKGDVVLDLGCSPGSWLVFTAHRIGRKGKVVGVDLSDFNISLPQNCQFIKADIMDSDLVAKVGKDFDVVLSDLSPKLSGIKEIDTENSFLICQKALQTALAVLKPGGNFVCKVFDNEMTSLFVNKTKKHFSFVKRFKPRPSKASREFYLIAKELL